MKLKDYEYQFCVRLHELLKEQVKGKVYTTIKDDVLHVEIHYKDLKFEIAFEYFSDRYFNYNLTPEDMACGVIYEYKYFIIDRYFYD